MKKKNRILCYGLLVLIGVFLWGCGEDEAETETTWYIPSDQSPTSITFSEENQKFLSENGQIIMDLTHDAQEQVLSFIADTAWTIQIFSEYNIPTRTSSLSSHYNDWLIVEIDNENAEMEQKGSFLEIKGEGSDKAYNIHFKLSENSEKEMRGIGFNLSSYYTENGVLYSGSYNGYIQQSIPLFEDYNISISYAGKTERPKAKHDISQMVSEANWIHIITLPNQDYRPYYKVEANNTGEERRARILCKTTGFGVDSLTIIQSGIKVEKQINVTTAGTLSDLIPFEEKYKITDLTLAGELNNDDIRYIREMAGIDYAGQGTEGVLANLNMAEVNMTSSPEFSGSKLVSIILPDSTRSLTTHAFDNCYSLSSVFMPNQIYTLDNYAFKNCFSLSTIELPSELTDIGQDCFSGCFNLQSLIIPNKVTTIDDGAFQDCTKLTELTLPSELQNMGEYIFARCTNLKALHCKATEPPLCDGELGIEEATTLYIPKGTLVKYKDAAIWKNFKNTIEE